MNNKTSIKIGIVLLFSSLLFFCGYFAQKTSTYIMQNSNLGATSPAVSLRSRTPEAFNVETILSGNIFQQTRGRSNPDILVSSPNASAASFPSGQFELTGIFRYRNTRGALIAMQQTQSYAKKATTRRIYRAGDSLGNGYNLVEISDTQVTIARGSEQITLPLRKKQDKKK